VGVYALFGPLEDAFTTIACGIFPDLCNFAQVFLTSKDPSLDNTARFQVYMGHFPSGSSVQSLIHYAQLITEKDFYLFDWGSKADNQKYYG
jgi:hypothetical protein